MHGCITIRGNPTRSGPATPAATTEPTNRPISAPSSCRCLSMVRSGREFPPGTVRWRVRLHYVEAGRGEPMLLHGFPEKATSPFGRSWVASPLDRAPYKFGCSAK